MKHTVLIKYLFSILLIVIGFVLYKNIFVASFALIELLIIFLISNFLVNKNKVIGLIVNSIMMVLLNTNLIIYIFSHSYLSYFMVSNVTSVRALGTKLCIYIPCLLVTLMLTLLPIKPIKKIKSFWVLIIVPVYVLLLIGFNKNESSIGNYITLAKIYYDDFAMKIRIKKMHLDNNLFLQYSVSDYVKYDNSLGEQPNILLLFVEGMSSNNVEDKKNIMPNTKKYMEKSLRFENYYNHTAPTYRGLIGQLYSGYQLENNDTNKLVSLQNVLKNTGYSTYFVNVETENEEFTTYLNSMGFDEVLSFLVGQENSGKEFEYLYDKAIELNQTNKPFLLSIYNVETHIGWDNSEHCYKNCKNSLYNKFYNFDYYYGEFMKKFEESEFFDNTIVIFTTDHATYDDKDFYAAYPNYSRYFSFLDEVPFFIYHKGVKKRVIDANGRNSLDLVPTILDYIDVSDINCFLGDSLFSSENKSKYNYYYFAPGCYYTSVNATVSDMDTKKKEEFEEDLIKYFAVSKY